MCNVMDYVTKILSCNLESVKRLQFASNLPSSIGLSLESHEKSGEEETFFT